MSEPKLAKYLRWLVYASALVPLIIFAQYISPFHFGKVVILRAVVQVMAALYLLLIWRDRSYLPKSHPITWAFFAFALAFTITTLTSVAPLQSWWGTLERMGGLFTFWHYFVFYVITIAVMRKREHWQTLIHLTVAVGVVSALYGFLQKTDWSIILGSGNRTRPFGTIGNAALFAGYQLLVAYLAATMVFMKRLGPNAPAQPRALEHGAKLVGGGLLATLLLALIFSGHGVWVIPLGVVFYGVYLLLSVTPQVARWSYIVASGLMFVAVLMTAVRGSLLAIVVSTLVFALLWSTLNKSRKAKTTLLGAVAAVIVFFFLAIMLRGTPLVKNSSYLTRITDFSSSTYTVQTRLWTWSAGLKGWTESPRTMAIGWGPEHFNVPFSKYFNPKFYTGPGAETFFDRAHNMFVEVLVTMGLLGLLAYLSLFGALFWTLAKFMKRDDSDYRALGIGLTAMTVAYAIHNAFIFDTSANFLVFFTILALVVSFESSVMSDESVLAMQDPELKTRPWTALHTVVAVILGVAVAVLVYKTNVRPTAANYASTRAIIAGWQGDFPAAVNQYRKAIDMNTPGRYEFRNRFSQYLLEVSGSAGKLPNYNEVVLQAIDDVKNNVDESPQDYLPLLHISRMYITLGRNDAASPYNDKALEYSMRALDISPTFVRTYFEVAQAYLNKKDYDKAAEWFSKALELNPEVATAYWYRGLVRMQQGQLAKNDALIRQGLDDAIIGLKKGYQMTEGDAQKIAAAYIALGDLKSVAALYQQVVRAFPTNIVYWEQLIAVYIKMGDRDAAIAAIKAGLAQPGVGTDPAFKAKAEATLKELGAK